MTEGRYEQRLSPGSAGAQGPHATATVHNHYGTRPHTIEEFPAPSLSDVGWLMAQPSRLLDARSQVVGFIGRQAELRRLREWRDSAGARLSVLLLHAPGGQGKTRLAAEFAEQSRGPDLPAARRWRVLHARLHSGAARSVSAGEALPAWEGAGILLIADYADRWAYTEWERLFAEPALQLPCPVRVLLVGRTVRWYAAIRGEFDERRAAADDFPLPRLEDDRLSVFAAARDRYAQPDLYNLPDAADIQPPSSLDHPDFGLTLTLHMAALATVDAHSRGQCAPSGPHELSAYLLDREYRAWQRLFDAGRQGQDYQTRPSVMAKAVFTAALTGAVSHDTGTQALRAVDLPGHPQDVLLDHRFCYPPVDPELVLEPLYPDRLAEDFLGLLVPGHEISAYDPDPWTVGVPAGLLADGLGLRPAVALHALPVLAAAADRWPHLRERVLYPLLEADPGLALDGGSAALAALAGIEHFDPAILEAVDAAIEARVGAGRHVDLDVGIAAVTERLVVRRIENSSLKTGYDALQRASWYQTLSVRMDNAGCWDQALSAAEAALGLCRMLVDHDAVRPSLADCLITYGLRLSALDRHEEALAAGEQAVAIYQQLAQADPATYRYRLAVGLGNVGMFLSRLGRDEEAFAKDEKANRLFRQLVADGADTYLPELARSLINLGGALSRNGRQTEALSPTEEGISIWRKCAQADPAAHLPDLALALDTSGSRLSDLSRREEALGPVEEAVTIRRRLAEANPDAFQSDLASSLDSLVDELSALGRPEQALTPCMELVAVRRQLAAGSDGHLPKFAKALTILGILLYHQDRHTEAGDAFEEAVGVCRRLAAIQPNAPIAAELRRLGQRLAGVGRSEQALAAIEEAVAILGQLAKSDPDAHLSTLAGWLTSLGVDLSKVGQHERALAADTEAVAINRRLAASDPGAHLPSLAAALNNLGTDLARHKQWEQALAAVDEATGLNRRLAAASESYLPDLAVTLDNLGGALAESGRREQAVAATGEAVGILRQLARNEDAYLPKLAKTLDNLAADLAALRHDEQALAATDESLSIFDQLLGDDADTYLPDFAAAVHRSSIRRYNIGKRVEAMSEAERAIALYYLLATTGPGPDAYLPALEDLLAILRESLSSLFAQPNALTDTERAVSAYRARVATLHPDFPQAGLGGALREYARVRAARGVEVQQALKAAQEAVKIFHRLAQNVPGAFTVDLDAARETFRDASAAAQPAP